WEFEVENGSSEFLGSIKKLSHSAMLLHSATHLQFGENSYTYVIFTPRHHGQDFSSLSSRQEVPCNGVGIPTKRMAEARNLDISWWRGGDAIIGSLSLVGPTR